VRNHIDDLVPVYTVLKRLPQVELELVALIESDEARDGDEAAEAIPILGIQGEFLGAAAMLWELSE
jgi:hypothetical protein